MLTIDEYRMAYCSAERRCVLRFGTIWVLAIIYLFLPPALYAINFGVVRDDHMDWVLSRLGETWPIVILAAYFMPAAALMFYSTRRVSYGFDNESKLKCPNCGKVLAGKAMIIASQKCQHCHQIVLVQPEPSIETNKILTAEVLKLAADRSSTRVVWMVIGGFCSLAAFWALAPLTVGDRPGPHPIGAAFFVLGIVSFIAFMAFGIHRQTLDRPSRCVHCGKCLIEYHHAVFATGNCGHCGRRVLADPALTAADSNSASNQ